MERDQAIDVVLCAYARISEVVVSLTMDLWVNLDLSMAQVKALFVIAGEDGISIGGASEALGVSVPTASHLVEKLVRSRLVSRAEDQTDRRRAVVSLTDDGRQLVDGLRQGSREQLREWFERLTEDELGALQVGITALARVAAECRRHPESAPAHSHAVPRARSERNTR